MATGCSNMVLPKRDLRGSRLRCLLLTHQPRQSVAKLLTELAGPFAVVGPDDSWMPGGLLQPDEAKLGESPAFLSDDQRETLTGWWLEMPKNANTPNSDIASACSIEGQRGLLLIEAKAHDSEFSDAGKPKGNLKNDESIRQAVQQANKGLKGLHGGWNLSVESCYQLCNRFAWSWKVATLGVPVILVYLGFLNADEMADRGQPFGSAGEWEKHVRNHAKGTVPDAAWGQRLKVNGTPMRALVRAMNLRWEAIRCEDESEE